jgi:hypothetical protein
LRIGIPLRTLSALAALVLLSRAEIIDRIAVSVGTSVVTTSDLDREIRVTAFLNGVMPDFSPANKRGTAERMVEQTLVRRELETSRYPGPEPSAAEKELNEFRTRHYPTAGEFARALQQDGITEKQVLDELLWQLTLLRFIQVRFQPGIQVTDEDIQNYFEQTVKPAAQAANPDQTVTLDAYRRRIERTLSGQRADKELDNWLKETRQRTDIVYHEEAFQ